MPRDEVPPPRKGFKVQADVVGADVEEERIVGRESGGLYGRVSRYAVVRIAVEGGTHLRLSALRVLFSIPAEKSTGSKPAELVNPKRST